MNYSNIWTKLSITVKTQSSKNCCHFVSIQSLCNLLRGTCDSELRCLFFEAWTLVKEFIHFDFAFHFFPTTGNSQKISSNKRLKEKVIWYTFFCKLVKEKKSPFLNHSKRTLSLFCHSPSTFRRGSKRMNDFPTPSSWANQCHVARDCD